MCAIHCTNANDNFTALNNLLNWKVMLKAAKIRSYATVLNLFISELNDYPVRIMNHRKCYQSFEHILHLESVTKALNIYYIWKV